MKTRHSYEIGWEKEKQKSQQHLARHVHLNIEHCKYTVVSKVAKILGWKICDDRNENFDILWTDSGQNIIKFVRKAKQFQRINHFPGMIKIYRKNGLARSMRKLQIVNKEEYSFFPTTWVLPDDYSEIVAFTKKHKDTVLIVKPSCGAQGKGIYLAVDVESIARDSDAVVQTYVQKPLLIDGFKFDLRIYVLVVCCDPLRILIYDEGLVRICTG